MDNLINDRIKTVEESALYKKQLEKKNYDLKKRLTRCKEDVQSLSLKHKVIEDKVKNQVQIVERTG